MPNPEKLLRYYGFAGNYATLNKFTHEIERMWFKWLNRRSQRNSFNWEEFEILLTRFPLRKPQILNGYRWIYSPKMWACLKSRMRENCLSGSIRGRGQLMYGWNMLAPPGNQTAKGESKHQPITLGETGLFDSVVLLANDIDFLNHVPRLTNQFIHLLFHQTAI